MRLMRNQRLRNIAVCKTDFSFKQPVIDVRRQAVKKFSRICNTFRVRSSDLHKVNYTI